MAVTAAAVTAAAGAGASSGAGPAPAAVQVAPLAQVAMAAQPAPAPPPNSRDPMTADELILQFKRPELKTALRNAPQAAPARAAVQRALDALGQRQGVALHYLQTLGVGSALVAVAPASAQLDALVARLAADAEVESVEVNARMTTMRPGTR